MCVIICKSEEAKMPTYNRLSDCWNSNPDGAGYMFEQNGSVCIRKGFMNFADFCEDIGKQKLEDKAVILHFRIRTTGDVSKGNTHPFQVCGSYQKMKRTRAYCKMAIAHNGIFQITRDDNRVSDTMAFVKKHLTACPELLTKDSHINIIDSLIGSSRLAYMDHTGEISVFGSGWTKEDNCYYSNTSFRYASYGQSGGWDWEDTDYDQQAFWYRKYKLEKEQNRKALIIEHKKKSLTETRRIDLVNDDAFVSKYFCAECNNSLCKDGICNKCGWDRNDFVEKQNEFFRTHPQKLLASAGA